jgi:acyl carrier protein
MPSTVTVDAVARALMAAMEQINCQRRRNDRIEITPATILVGEGTALDSLLLVSFLVAAEERLAADHGLRVSLLDLVADDGEHAALKTIGTLSRHLTAMAGAV